VLQLGSKLLRALGRIRVRLLVVNLVALLVPVAGLEFARVHERQLLDGLERDMRNQATLVRALVERDLDDLYDLGDERHTAILTGGRGYEGVGFAMPSNTAISVYNQIVEHGKVTRGSIGVTFDEEQSRNPILLRDLGAFHGVVLQSVEAGGPASRAGIQPGDVVTAINGKPVKSGPDLVNPIAETPIGGQVRVSYVRDRQQREASVTVDDRTKIFPDRVSSVPRSPQRRPEALAPAEVGLRLEELAAVRARRPDTYRNERGVMVAEVAPTSFGEDLGFLRGDLITEINHVSVTSVADYRRGVAGLKPGNEVVFKVLRQDDSTRVLTVFLAGVVPSPER